MANINKKKVKDVKTEGKVKTIKAQGNKETKKKGNVKDKDRGNTKLKELIQKENTVCI